MNELIAVRPTIMDGQSTNTVNARELHAFLEVGRDFTTWVKDRIEQYEFSEGQDFVVVENLSSPISGSSKARTQVVTDYHLSLDMAKELSMVERNAKGKLARQYFIACEKTLKKTARLLTESQKRKEAAHIIAADMMVCKILGTAAPMAKAIAVENARRLTGVDYANLLPPAKIEEIPVGVRKLAELSGVTERKVVARLIEKELATRDAGGNILLTDKAKAIKAGSMEPYKSRSSNHSGYQTKWFPSVVLPILKEKSE